MKKKIIYDEKIDLSKEDEVKTSGFTNAASELVSTICYSSSVPLLSKIKKSGDDYFHTFQNPNTGKIIEGIEYPVEKYKLSYYNLSEIKVEFGSGSSIFYNVDRDPDIGNSIILYDIDPIFRTILRNYDENAILEFTKETYQPPKKFEDDPELYRRIRNAIKANQFCNIVIGGRYYRGLRDPQTKKVIMEFLIPIAKYEIIPGDKFEPKNNFKLQIIVDTGVNLYKFYREDLTIYDLNIKSIRDISDSCIVKSNYSTELLKYNQEISDAFVKYQSQSNQSIEPLQDNQKISDAFIEYQSQNSQSKVDSKHHQEKSDEFIKNKTNSSQSKVNSKSQQKKSNRAMRNRVNDNRPTERLNMFLNVFES